jgi:hypothetical protein
MSVPKVLEVALREKFFQFINPWKELKDLNRAGIAFVERAFRLPIKILIAYSP